MKVIHKRGRMYSVFYSTYVVRPLCKIDNKTFAYSATTNWLDVTCKRCLAKKEK